MISFEKGTNSTPNYEKILTYPFDHRLVGIRRRGSDSSPVADAP